MNEPQLSLNNQQQPSKSMSITSLVLGILAMLLGPAAAISIPLGIAAIVTGVVALKRQIGKGMAVGGIIMGSIGIVIGLVGMLLIFIALPSLQRNQRDVQVKNDVSTASSAVASYRTNNRGALPTKEEFESADFRQTYLSDISTEIVYVPGESCDGASTTPTVYSVSAELEVGGQVCID